jgi:hypothetical protein
LVERNKGNVSLDSSRWVTVLPANERPGYSFLPIPGRQCDGGSLADIFVVRSAIRWLRFRSARRTVSLKVPEQDRKDRDA